MSTAAMADGPAFTIGFEGGFLFGDDHAYINEQPEYPGDVNHGDGATGALRIEGRQGMWAGFLDVRYWAGKDEATGVRSELSQIFGLHTITDTAETSARFTTIDLGIRRHVPTGGAELSFIAGLRFLSASHDNDERAITEGFFAADTLGRDRVDYWGVGPRIGVGAEGPIGSRFSWFGEVAATVLFGEMDVERRLSGIFQGEPLTPGFEAYSDSMTVYSFDAQLGISIALCDIDSMRTTPKLALGYRIEGWWNTHAASEFVEIYPDTDDFALHHGPFARLTMPLN